ncbi:hypothetical protein [Desulfosporosinus sp. FKA]|uniref:hypothetical protein n=1 Tax=Desulfosporosinus sp. FKA TaxID=1969834 RepID=UPI000B49B769|nr:hypothetical protein [Desulfosporosinus sp. FKA]
MAWTILNFGKYQGKTLPQILFLDPDWFYWAYDEGVFRNKGQLFNEAEEIYQKASSIKIPNLDDIERVAEYVIHAPTGKFGKLELVPVSRPPHVGGSPTFRKNVIDLSVPRQVAHYDKTGCALLLGNVKYYLFGANVRMTKKKCEDFFNDNDNFRLKNA